MMLIMDDEKAELANIIEGFIVYSIEHFGREWRSHVSPLMLRFVSLERLNGIYPPSEDNI